MIRTDDDIKNITNEKYSAIKSLYEAPSAEGTIIFPHRPKALPDDIHPDALKLDEAVPDINRQGEE
jgi:hypothetical protein